MHRFCLAVCLLAWTGASAARADGELCKLVAQAMWSQVAAAPLREQTPLAQLTALAAVRTGSPGLAKPGQSIAEALIGDHQAAEDLAHRLRDLPPATAMRLGDSDVWLLDRVDGTLGCHTAMLVAAPPGAPAREIPLPGSPDPSAMCALSALAAVTIDGTPALWVEQSGAFSNQLVQSTVSIAGLGGQVFEPPCLLTLDYTVTDKAAHAFCDGVDCVPLIQRAEILAMRLRQGETAETLGAGVLRGEDDEADYRRMAQAIADDSQGGELATFGAALDTPFTVFADAVTFPLRLDDGALYLARIGHGGLGWRQTADTLLELHRFRGGKLLPAASVYVAAKRTGIAAINAP